MTTGSSPPARRRRQKPESDKKYYVRSLSRYGRKAFEIVASSAFFFVVDRLIHWMLNVLAISGKSHTGHLLHLAVILIVALAYLCFVVWLLIPDASEQLSETRDKLKEHWGKNPND